MSSRLFSRFRLFVVVLLAGFAATGCVDRREFNYFQDRNSRAARSRFAPSELLPDTGIITTAKPYIHRARPNDLYYIRVLTLNQQQVNYLNTDEDIRIATTPYERSVMVDAEGNISVPNIPVLPVLGLTIAEIRKAVSDSLSKYYKTFNVQVKFENFQVSVLGEVGRPGLYSAFAETMTLPEALAQAGDLTPFADRHVQLQRRLDDGSLRVMHVDMRDRSVLMSDAYYMHPGDVLIVSSLDTRYTSARNNQAALIVSALSAVALLVNVYLNTVRSSTN